MEICSANRCPLYRFPFLTSTPSLCCCQFDCCRSIRKANRNVVVCCHKIDRLLCCCDENKQFIFQPFFSSQWTQWFIQCHKHSFQIDMSYAYTLRYRTIICVYINSRWWCIDGERMLLICHGDGLTVTIAIHGSSSDRRDCRFDITN